MRNRQHLALVGGNHDEQPAHNEPDPQDRARRGGLTASSGLVAPWPSRPKNDPLMQDVDDALTRLEQALERINDDG